MPFLTIGAQVDLSVARFRRLPSERGGGGLRRTIGGQLRGDERWSARNWEAEIIAENDAQAEALYALSDVNANVTVSGDAIGSSVAARIEESGEEYEMVDDAGAYHRVVTLRIREQVS